jgi:hypothetical protein
MRPTIDQTALCELRDNVSEPMETAEDRKFSAVSRRAIEIVMVMNSQPTLHDKVNALRCYFAPP